MLQSLEGLPCTLQILFYTTKGKQALADFLGSTEICIMKWLQKDQKEKEEKKEKEEEEEEEEN